MASHHAENGKLLYGFTPTARISNLICNGSYTNLSVERTTPLRVSEVLAVRELESPILMDERDDSDGIVTEGDAICGVNKNECCTVVAFYGLR